MTGEVKLYREIMAGEVGRLCGREEQVLMEDTLEGLQERMGLLDSTLEQHCDILKDRLQDHSYLQVKWKDRFTHMTFIKLIKPLAYFICQVRVKLVCL